MIRRPSAIVLVLASLAMPAIAMAAASGEDNSRLCPKEKPVASATQESPASTAPATTSGGGARPAPARSGGGSPGVRSPQQRWHSVLPGMVR